MTAGSTNMEACVNIMATKPSFVSPTKRMTPNSKALVSTEMRISEKTSNTATTTKMRSMMSKMSPMNIIAKLKISSWPSSHGDYLKLKNPRASVFSDKS